VMYPSVPCGIAVGYAVGNPWPSIEYSPKEIDVFDVAYWLKNRGTPPMISSWQSNHDLCLKARRLIRESDFERAQEYLTTVLLSIEKKLYSTDGTIGLEDSLVVALDERGDFRFTIQDAWDLGQMVTARREFAEAKGEFDLLRIALDDQTKILAAFNDMKFQGRITRK